MQMNLAAWKDKKEIHKSFSMKQNHFVAIKTLFNPEQQISLILPGGFSISHFCAKLRLACITSSETEAKFQ
jgi:hypothetical protein